MTTHQLLGRHVHYTLDAEDAEKANGFEGLAEANRSFAAGDVYPATIVAISTHPEAGGTTVRMSRGAHLSPDAVDLTVLCGAGHLWVRDVAEGVVPGTWSHARH